MNPAESSGPPLDCQHGNLWNEFQDVARRHSEAIALRCSDQPFAGLEWMLPPSLRPTPRPARLEWTYAQLSGAAQELAAGLRRSGLRPGLLLAVFCTGNTAEWASLFWACVSMGATFAPLNARLADSPAELRHVMETLQPSGIIALDHRIVVQLCNGQTDMIDPDRTLFKLTNGYKQEGHSLPDGWQPLTALLEDDRDASSAAQTQSTDAAPELSGQRATLALLTSGTTAMPKAAIHTDASLLSETALFSRARRLSANSTQIIVGPPFHILAVWSMLMAWRAGATVLHPSVEFDATASLEALSEYPVTHFPCSPAVINSMVSHPKFSPNTYDKLDVLSIGSDRVSNELLAKCRAFGANTIANGWGMTECIGVLAFEDGENIPWHGDFLSVGHVMPGSAVRVCAFDTTDIVARGELGELHVSGTSITSGYLDRGQMRKGDSFYDDADGVSWFRTGDAVIMDDSGAVYITGRFKDLIIRGGENVHPGLIEQCINKLRSIKSAQVFGSDEDSSGQAIIAVIQLEDNTVKSDSLKTEVQHAVTSELGLSRRLRSIYTLAELGLDRYPTTATGKIRKADLKARVHQVSEPGDSAGSASTLATLLALWRRLLGPGSDELVEGSSVNHVADSLIILRYCARVEQQLGKRISPAEVIEHDTPAAQAELLDGRAVSGLDQVGGTIDPSVMLSADQSWISPDARARIDTTMESLGLDREADLEAVYEPHDAMSLILYHMTTPSSGNFRWTLRAQTDISVDRLRECLFHCLAVHANMRSVTLPLEENTITPAHINLIIRPTEKWLNQIVEKTAPVRGEDDLQGLTRSLDTPFGQPHKPAFRAQIIPVQDSQRPALFFSANHTAFDAISIGSFLDDLNACVCGRSIDAASKIPCYVFAEMYRLQKGNVLSQNSDEYQIQKLRGIGQAENYEWPKSRGSMLVIGGDKHWVYKDTSKPRHPMRERVSLDEAAGKVRGAPVTSSGTFPHLQTLKADHGIEAHALVKAALAIFNIEQTGMEAALFGTGHAGRSWPFVDEWTAQHLPNVMNVAGPTFEQSLDFIKVDPKETPLELLARIVEAQRLDNIHCHASWDSIRRCLGQTRTDLRCFLVRQYYNWDSSFQSRGQQETNALRVLDRAAFMDLGCMWNFGQTRPGQIDCMFFYDDVHLSPDEAQTALDRVFTLLRWLAEPANLRLPLAEIVLRKLSGKAAE